MALPSKHRSVSVFVMRVGDGRFPFKMVWIDAAMVTSATFMSGLVDWRRRHSVHQCAHNARRLSAFHLTDPDLPSEPSHSITSASEWPYQAFIAFVLHMGEQPPRRFAPSAPERRGKRVPALVPLLVVSLAHRASANGWRLCTALDFAIRWPVSLGGELQRVAVLFEPPRMGAAEATCVLRLAAPLNSA